MSVITDPAALEFAETWIEEDAAILAARTRARELGVACVSQGVGAALRFLAACVNAHHVVELGTGTGVSGLWLLAGMAEDGVLTTIDNEAEHQRMARQSFAESGVAAARTRLINGQALDVLPRLTPAAYDLVHVDAAPGDAQEIYQAAVPLLRPGGIVAVSSALWQGRVADPSARDQDTVAMRGLVRVVRDDPRVEALLVPLGDGLIAAVLTG